MNIVAMALNFRRRTLLGVSESEDHLLIGVLRNWISHLLLRCSHFRSGHFEEIHLRKTWWGNSELALQIFIDFSILFSRVASYFNCLGWKPSGSIQLGWHWILEKKIMVFGQSQSWTITSNHAYFVSKSWWIPRFALSLAVFTSFWPIPTYPMVFILSLAFPSHFSLSNIEWVNWMHWYIN